MNETIGVKGGRNDRKRSLLITKKQKKALLLYYEQLKKEELKKLEKRVNQIQRITFIKTVPIVLAGQVYETLATNTKKQKISTKKTELEKSNFISLSYINEKQENKLPNFKDKESNEKKDKTQQKLNNFVEIVDSINKDEIDIIESNNVDKTNDKSEETSKKEEPKKKSKVVEVIVEDQKSIPIRKTVIDPKKELERIKNHKIVDEYEKKLKDVRTELRKLIFEYNVLVQESEDLYDSKEAERLLDKLNDIIEKMEQLKRKIELPDIDKYDDNYLYTLIEDYIDEFSNKKVVEDIKDSNLYISISEKLDELDTKKDTLTEKIETRKEKLEFDEDKLEKIKEKYFDYEKFNTDLLRFQSEQDFIMQEMNQKIANATTVTEKVEVQVQGMTKQSKRLLQLLALQMMLPGARSAKGLATATAIYLYFMKSILNPKTRTRRYKVINVEDYKKEIENSLYQLDDISNLLKRTSAQLDTMIKKFKKDYAEYFSVLPECAELLANLEKIQRELREKEYELEKIKQEQQRNLDKNDAKVKCLENY